MEFSFMTHWKGNLNKQIINKSKKNKKNKQKKTKAKITKRQTEDNSIFFFSV